MTGQQYAALSFDVYSAPKQAGINSPVVDIGGVSYKRLEYVDRPSGYQGILYQRIDDGELIIAHRGTEFDRQPLRDGFFADGGMVAARHNAQVADAVEFTRKVLKYANAIAKEGEFAAITVTGHSLGGNLAQVTAHHFGLKGETFNAYGAVSLDRRIPEGGVDVINHVMAGDPVSAASRHYGQVRLYATSQEVAMLEHAGYDNSRGVDLRNPVSAVKGLIVESHRMHNFLPVDGNGRPDRSVLEDPPAMQRAQRCALMIDKYREDVASLRVGATVWARGVRGLAADALNELRGPLPPGEGRRGLAAPDWSEHMQQLHAPRMEGDEPQGWRAPLKFPEPSGTGPADPQGDPLYHALKSRLPAGIPEVAVLHAASQARREGMERPEQIKAVTLLESGGAWIEGSIPGYRVKVDLSGTSPAVQGLRTDQAVEVHLAQQQDAVQQHALGKAR